MRSIVIRITFAQHHNINMKSLYTMQLEVESSEVVSATQERLKLIEIMFDSSLSYQA
jgi:hypothetical protein